jgi:hypothetical protein
VIQLKNPIAIIAFTVLFAFVLSGAKNCEREIETRILKPDSKGFYLMIPGHGDAGTFADSPIGVPCPGTCFYTLGRSCNVQLPGNDSTVVGYSHTYDPGTQPCRCWEYVNCAYRGYVGFNTDALKNHGIVTARLTWTDDTAKSYGGSVSNEPSCIKSIYYATEPWKTDSKTKGEFVGDYSPGGSSAASFDVAPTIRGWVNGTLPNHGFFFVGFNENVNEKNNDRCMTILSNLRLEVVTSKKP